MKAGASQLEEVVALPASGNCLVCFDNGPCLLSYFKSTMQEGPGSCHLLSPIKLWAICRAAAVAAPALGSTTFGQNGTTFQELLELILSPHWRKELRGLSSIWRTYFRGLQWIISEVWVNYRKFSNYWSYLTSVYHAPLFLFRKTE